MNAIPMISVCIYFSCKINGHELTQRTEISWKYCGQFGVSIWCTYSGNLKLLVDTWTWCPYLGDHELQFFPLFIAFLPAQCSMIPIRNMNTQPISKSNRPINKMAEYSKATTLNKVNFTNYLIAILFWCYEIPLEKCFSTSNHDYVFLLYGKT